MPECFKIAAVLPLLKTIVLDVEIFKNLKPVSTLPFVSKMMERVAEKHVLTHTNMHKLHGQMQSAYRNEHSTETALLRIQNDVFYNMFLDSIKCVMLVLLDLSVSFNTMDDNIPLQRLSNRFGIYRREYLSG